MCFNYPNYNNASTYYTLVSRAPTATVEVELEDLIAPCPRGILLQGPRDGNAQFHRIAPPSNYVLSELAE